MLARLARRKPLHRHGNCVIEFNMNTSSPSPPLAAATPELARRLGGILAGLAALIAARFLRMPHLMALTVPLWGFLGRAARRFARALIRPAVAVGTRARKVGVSRPKGFRPPSQRGWLVRELGWEAAAFTCQLEALLADPAMQAVLAELPAVGRILRPLCRMLGVVTPVAVAPPPVVVVIATAPPTLVAEAVGAGFWPLAVRAILPGAISGNVGIVTRG